MGTKNTKPERKTELSLDVHDNGGSTERLNGYLKGAGFEYIRGAGCYFTKEYVIVMGQDQSDSYYPANYFDITECLDAITIETQARVVDFEGEEK